MIQYLAELIEKIEPKGRVTIGVLGQDHRTQSALIDELFKEIGRLDPRDFAPAVQCEFVVLRAEVNAWAGYPVTSFNPNGSPFKRLRRVLQYYGGPNSQAKSRSFKYISDADVRKIVERDYRELSLLVFSAGAWKSAVILAGSILEALLYEILTANPRTALKANAALAAPRFKGKVKPIGSGDWRLCDLIDVASELQILPPDRAKTN